MLEGLEIQEVLLSEIHIDNEEFRLDDDYYRKEYISIYSKISDYALLKDIVTMSDVSSNGSFAYVQETLNDNNPKIIPYIRSGNVGETFIYHDDLVKISKEAHDKLKLSQTKLHDIMMARKGKIGGASIITEQEVNFNCNENVIKLSIKDATGINPFYFVTFFNSKYGIKQIERLSTGNVQPWVSIYQIRKLRLSILSSYFQSEIENVVRNAHRSIQKSLSYYSVADKLLAEELYLKDWACDEHQVNIKRYKESFIAAGRLDAEYYQTKYDAILKKICKNRTKRLFQLVEMQKSVEPGSDYYLAEGVPFVRVADLTKFGITKPSIFLDKDIFKDVIRPKQDTILMSKDGSIGIAYKVEKDEDFITSGAILHLQIIDDNILPDYLTLVINSKVVQMQAERDAGGSIIQHWKPSEISNVVIPILPMEKQQEISQKVQESFRLRNESKRLLNVAKTAVEIAIGESEETALEYLKENENG